MNTIHDNKAWIRAHTPPPLVNLTDINKTFLNDRHRFEVVSAGRRSRKTLLAKRKMYYTAPTKLNINKRYFQGAPTRKQAKNIFWKDLKRDYYFFQSRRPSETELIVFLQNGTEIHVVGLENAERIEGQPWDGAIITEFANLKPDIWGENIQPMFADTGGWAILEGVAEGRNHYYKHALYSCGGAIPETIPGVGAIGINPEDPLWGFYTWHSADVLPESEIIQARRVLDPRTFAQEYEGSFESYEGQLYYCFSRENVSEELTRRDYNEVLNLSCDFNKNPMVWEISQNFEYKGYKSKKIIKELAIPYNAKTPAMIRLFLDYFGDHSNKTVKLRGDASGKPEGHLDHTTDYVMIRDKLRSAGFRVIMQVPDANPSVNNRTNIVNSLLKSDTDKIRLFISPKCLYLIDDLEQNESDDKGKKDKSDTERTHASDCTDYDCWIDFAQEFYKKKPI